MDSSAPAIGGLGPCRAAWRQRGNFQATQLLFASGCVATLGLFYHQGIPEQAWTGQVLRREEFRQLYGGKECPALDARLVGMHAQLPPHSALLAARWCIYQGQGLFFKLP
jgi:hypothetical protein